MTHQVVLRIALAVPFCVSSATARASDPPSLSGGSRDAYDRAVDRGLGVTTGSDRPRDVYERAADRVFGEARRDAFQGIDVRTRDIGARVASQHGGYNVAAKPGCVAAVESYTWSCVVVVPTSALACVASLSRGNPVGCLPFGVAAAKCAVDSTTVNNACESKGGPSGSEHGGSSPSGSDRGAAAAAGL